MLHFRSNHPPLQTATLFSVSRGKCMCVVAYVVRCCLYRALGAYVMSWCIYVEGLCVCRAFVRMSCVRTYVCAYIVLVSCQLVNMSCVHACRAFVRMSCVRTYIVCMWCVRVYVCILCARAYVFMLCVLVYVYIQPCKNYVTTPIFMKNHLNVYFLL